MSAILRRKSSFRWRAALRKTSELFAKFKSGLPIASTWMANRQTSCLTRVLAIVQRKYNTHQHSRFKERQSHKCKNGLAHLLERKARYCYWTYGNGSLVMLTTLGMHNFDKLCQGKTLWQIQRRCWLPHNITATWRYAWWDRVDWINQTFGSSFSKPGTNLRTCCTMISFRVWKVALLAHCNCTKSWQQSNSTSPLAKYGTMTQIASNAAALLISYDLMMFPAAMAPKIKGTSSDHDESAIRPLQLRLASSCHVAQFLNGWLVKG